MRYTKDDLAGKSDDELLAIGNGEFNLGLDRRYKKDSMIFHIVEASRKFGSDAVKALHTEEEVEQAANALPKGFAIVRLHKSQQNPQGHHAFIGFQGEGNLMPVGIDCVIPDHLLEILDNGYTHEWVEDPITKDFKEQLSHRHAFTVLKHNPSDKWLKHEAMTGRNSRKMSEFMARD